MQALGKFGNAGLMQAVGGNGKFGNAGLMQALGGIPKRGSDAGPVGGKQEIWKRGA